MEPNGRIDKSTLPWSDSSSDSVGAPTSPALTVLFHPDTARIGERAILSSLARGETATLSRNEPALAQPREPERRRALLDPQLSRHPIHLRPAGAGGLHLDPRGAAPVILRGQQALDPFTVAPEALERGVVITLSHRIVLLLHSVSPRQAAMEGPLPSLDVTGIAGESDSIRHVIWQAQSVAGRDLLVFLRGESGTGKELVANAIHRLGARRDGPFIAVNLGAIPPGLASAELFGTTKWAYTGAVDAPGYFEKAHRGTLFLDEVGEAPVTVQAALLRAIETGQIYRLGERSPRTPDVRIVVATDADLEARVAGHEFREALLNRLSGYEIRVPPLRERRDDIGRLLLRFLQEELQRIGEPHRLAAPGDNEQPWLPASIVARFADQDWPGNVRALRQAARRLVIDSHGRERATLSPELFAMVGRTLGSRNEQPGGAVRPSPAVPPPAPSPVAPPSSPPGRRPADYADHEIASALRAAAGSVAKTAQALSVKRPALDAAIKRNADLHDLLVELRAQGSPAKAHEEPSPKRR